MGETDRTMRPTTSNLFGAAEPMLRDEVVHQRRGDSLELLVGELQHRIKNLFSVVQCLVVTTDASTADGYRTALAARIACLSDAYALIERTREHRVSLVRLLERTLEHHAKLSSDRIVLSGPDVTLEPHCALSLHMIFHELATNASKHGALKSGSGGVEVFWELLPRAGSRTLALRWRERGGPEVTKPRNKGFGLRLIAKAPSVSQVDMDFAPDGLVCRLTLEIEPAV